MKNGWRTKRVRDLCEVIAGQSPEGKFYNSEGKGMAFYQGKKDFGEKFIGAPSTWTTEITKTARKGDILMSVRAPVGPVNFATNDICIGRGLAAIRTGSELNRDFLFYQLLHLQPEIAGKEGAVFASINKAEIEALPLAFAPLPEQRRIVGILDEAFAGIATAKANAEKNLRNAIALFRNRLEAVFSNKHWEVKKLRDIAEYFIGLTYSPKDVSDKGLIVLRSSNIQNGQLDFSDIVRVNRPVKESLKVKSGDILMCSRNGSKRLVGKTAMINGLTEEMTFGTFMTVIRSEHNRFLSWFFKSDEFRHQIGVGENTMINQITKYMLDAILVPLPLPAEQQTVVREIELLSVETQRLASLYERKIEALKALKKSLLHRSFSGEL